MEIHINIWLIIEVVFLVATFLLFIAGVVTHDTFYMVEAVLTFVVAASVGIGAL